VGDNYGGAGRRTADDVLTQLLGQEDGADGEKRAKVSTGTCLSLSMSVCSF
jgi:hypothetical protein